jgi:hypothetical protein
MMPSPQAPSSAGLDIERLDGFLRAHVADLSGPLRLTRILGGQSNPDVLRRLRQSLAHAPQAAAR